MPETIPELSKQRCWELSMKLDEMNEAGRRFQERLASQMEIDFKLKEKVHEEREVEKREMLKVKPEGRG